MTLLLEEYLRRSAERHPEKIAVVMDEERISYGELERESNRLARLLVESGCRSGDRVCLLQPKSPAAIVAMLGVLKAGGAYVPIDVSSPAPRVKAIVRACEPRLVLACEETTQLADEVLGKGEWSIKIGMLDDSAGPEAIEPVFRRADWGSLDAGPCQSGNSSGDLAHILFTSGSTGVPKGVMITHSNVVHFVEWATSYFGTTSSDRISGHPPLHFDLSTFDIYGTLLVGAELHLVPPEASYQPDTLVDFIRVNELTQWFSVPSALTFMAKYGAVRQDDFPHLKRLIWCGEVIPTPTLIEWMRCLPHVDFTNLYGPTEATIASSYFKVDEIPEDPTAAVSIGEACGGEELVVLGGEMQPLPTGETGEIYIGGVGLSPGYWRDAEKTAAAFQIHEAKNKDGTRLYRTGDLGYYGPDGLLYILGRVDSQIKSRGYRIELGEIEAALNAQPVIKECAVVGMDVGGFVGTAICCAYSPLDRDELSHVELRERLARQLPSYMLPSHWLELDALPKNINGKIDRRTLKERFERESKTQAAREADEEAVDAPRGAAQAVRQGANEGSLTPPVGPDLATEGEPVRGALADRLAAVAHSEWDSVVLEIVQRQTVAILVHLSPESVDPDRAFKDLGLDSLGAVDLSSRLVEATGLQLAPTLIFDHPTPAAVAKFLRSKVEGAGRGTSAGGRTATVSDEPIAIVGMSCRYPGGVRSREDLWKLLVSEHDAIGEFPSDRGWDLEGLYDPDPDRPGTSYSRHGGFVYDAGEFDAGFFSIGPREALAMDPQQRLLLEGAWEAFEDAGIDPTSLRGSSTGVFAGIVSVFTPDGGQFLGPEDLEGFWLTGSSASVASGRVSYFLGLEGPAVSVDTACSSSLVAIHLACQGLRSGECSLALAGGATVLASPGVFIAFSRQRALSPDGRCRSFAAGADGTGWAEGVGLLVLERLSDAQRNGHRVLGLVRGSAINQDGASNGLTAPNGPSQERVIRQALRSAGLTPSEVDVVEAHGTGTPLGDPIEAQALLATYGQDRLAGSPLYLGSVKSNIGHTQAAAGVAGVIKMVEAMRHGLMPKSLHVDEPSPHVDWSEGEVELLREALPWPVGERLRRAGVSSFGISGTNAHVVLEEAPGVVGVLGEVGGGVSGVVGTSGVGGSLGVGSGVLLFPVSGVSDGAVVAQAERLRVFLGGESGVDLEGVARTLAFHRASLERRAVVCASGRDELLGLLGALGRGEVVEGVVRGVARRGGGVAFMFSGQGSQWGGMGRGLWEAFPVFRGALDEVCAEFDGCLGRSLRDLLFADEGSSEAELLGRTRFTQPALFALEVALFRLIGVWGIVPDYLIGHSVGELSAAYVAGVLSLGDACALVAARGRLMEELTVAGAMVAVQASEAEVLEGLEGFEGRLSLAGVNGPSSVVVSGELEAIEGLASVWSERGRKTSRLRVSHAFHSHLMEPMLDEFGALVEGLSFGEAVLPIVSNVTGELLSAQEACSPAYWVGHVREPVRFYDGVRYLEAAGVTRFLEIGPDGVLSAMVSECLSEQSESRVLLGTSMRAKRPETAVLMKLISEAHVDGIPIDWHTQFTHTNTPPTKLPTYPFQRQRYWLEAGVGKRDAGSLGQSSAQHPLLGAATMLAGGDGWLFTGRLSLQSQPWLADHAVADAVLFPGTGFVDLALAAGQRIGAHELQELTLQMPLVLDERNAVQLQLAISEPDAAGFRKLDIYSRPDGSSQDESARAWKHHASGVLGEGVAGTLTDGGIEQLTAQEWPPPGAQPIDTEFFYDRLSEAGYGYGPVFQGLRAAWTVGSDIFAEVALGVEQALRADGFCVHPALLDAALHTSVFQALDGKRSGEIGIPFAFSGVRLYGAGARALRVRICAHEGMEKFSLFALDGSGAPVLAVDSLLVRQVDRRELRSTRTGVSDSLFSLDWVEVPALPPNGRTLQVVALGSDERFAQEMPEIELKRYPDLAALVEAIDAGAALPDLVLAQCLAPADWRELCAATHMAIESTLDLAKQWIAAEQLADAKLVILTNGAVATAVDEAPELATAALWGLLRSAQSEHPERFGLIDLDNNELSLRSLQAALASDEPQLTLREGILRAPRLSRLAVSAQAPASRLDSRGTVLITGGTGGLGALVARHLAAEHGVRHLLLISRRGKHAEGAEQLQASLLELGCEVSIVACDVTDREALARLIESVPPEFPLTAVIHAAGVLDDGVISSLDGERLRRVMAPKVDAAIYLHELTEHLELSEFLLFSSISSTLGAQGQGNYSAANAFLDGLAAHRRARGLPGRSLAWGAWAATTAMTDGLSEADRGRWARMGITALSDEQGLELLDAALGVDEPLLLPVGLDVGALRVQARSGALPALMRGLVLASAPRVSDAQSSLARRLEGAAHRERDAIVRELVLSHTAAVLGHTSGEAIDAARAFKELGFDSLGAVELRNRLGEATGLRLSSTLIFDHPTPAGVAEFLRSKVEGAKRHKVVPPRAANVEEPIAIVGMSCRYPGGIRSPDELWELVFSGGDGISLFPTDRGWDIEGLYDPDPDRQGTSYAREGGFLHGAGDFDAGFFGIGPREALAMDPQQRLLLEMCWEAVEDAGLDPHGLKGSQTGVFAGVMYHDYGIGLTGPTLAGLEGYLGTGSAGSVVSGRVAYALGLEGPAITIDTACSSSLVALHWACHALRTNECSLALAGGVTVLWTPGLFVDYSRQRALARDGRCKSYADAADGTGWGEGIGVLVLERLSEAQRNEHQVLAVVRGSAVNQDGASNGLTAPNGPSQQRVIAQALVNAGLAPSQIDAVEGHGTGTTLGDPIEAEALIASYGQDRLPSAPLWLGSVKSNIGHTQAAAGVAGVIKMVMAMRHGVLPKTINVDRPSTEVDWSAGAVSLLTEEQPWPVGECPRRAGVSSFGISGTNAHVVLEEAPGVVGVLGEVGGGVSGVVGTSGVGGSLGVGSGVLLFPVSGVSDGAVVAQAERLRVFLGGESGVDLEGVARTLAFHRASLERRAVVCASGRDELLGLLGALGRGEVVEGVVRGVARRGGGVAFMFSGQGSQWGGMGRGLWEAFPVFRGALDEVCAEFDGCLGRSLRDLLFADEGSSEAELLGRTRFTQPALFALEVALFRLIGVWGIVPDYLIGHSVGELSAAYVAGVLSLGDACALVAARGRLMEELTVAGAMVAVQASEAEVLEGLEGFEGRLSLAGVNGPSSVVVSGELEAIEGLASVWSERGRKTSRLRVSHAFHSHLMEPMLDEFGALVEGLSFGEAVLPIVSNVTGELLSAQEACSPAYWVGHVREPVRFYDGVRYLEAAGVTRFLEIGPDGVLSAMVSECLSEQSESRVLLGTSMRAKRPETAVLMKLISEAHVDGIPIDWHTQFTHTNTPPTKLPTYPFQRQRYWLDPPAREGGDVGAAGLSVAGHPLLGAMIGLAEGDGWLFTGRLSLRSHPWLADHAVLGNVLFAGTAFVEIALHAGIQVGCEFLQELVLEAPLVLGEDDEVQLQLSVGDPDGDGCRELQIHSRLTSNPVEALPGAHAWRRHASGVLAPGMAQDFGGEFVDGFHGRGAFAEGGELVGETWPPEGAVEVPLEGLYERLALEGFEYGPEFQGLRSVWRGGKDLFAEVSLSEEQLAQGELFGLHPALLDAALHALIASPLDEASEDSEEPRLPFSWGGIRLQAAGASRLRVHFTATEDGGVSLRAVDDAGAGVFSAESLVTRPISAEQLEEQRAQAQQRILRVDWSALALDATASFQVPAGDARMVLLESLSAPGGSSASGVDARPEASAAVALRAAGVELDGFEDLVSLGQAVDEGVGAPAIVLVELEGATAKYELVAEGGVAAATRECVTRTLGLVQAWLADQRFSDARLAIVSSGVVGVGPDEDVSDLGAASAWGLVRSAQSEHPGRFVLVDVDGTSASWAAVAKAASCGEPQVAIRDGVLFAPRLTPAGLSDGLSVPEGGANWRLVTGGSDTLEDLAVVACSDVDEALGVGEVRVAVRAAGLNFRDVLIALGMYPESASIGSEGAGVVLEVGAGVDDLCPGDRVMGLLPGAFGSVAITDRRWLARMPLEWSFAQAASMPIVFLTAYYALVDLAGLRAGQRLLVHAATGGVGMAAVQLARHLGAEVFATASTGKWGVLEGMGFEQERIASSRTPEFRDRFLEQTHGEGMDVVLDSLVNELVDASLELLPRGGRFVEMGKADIRDPAEVASSYEGVVYRAFDLMDAGPERVQEMSVELLALFECGALTPLPVRGWDVRRAPDAFRFMSQARHVGKNVLTMPAPPGEWSGTALITGGTGGLGALLAKHLVVERGVRSLLLASRRGLGAPGADELAQELRELGAEIQVCACDTADREQLRALLAEVPAENPLSVVVHAAGVLDDGVLDALSGERLERVMTPKVDGAWHLHELTQRMDLQAFVLFSSSSATFGSPGQANYAAANAFLDALAIHRRARGLPAVSMAWGYWEQARGMTSDLAEADLARMERAGMRGISAEEGLEYFDLACGSDHPFVLPIELDRQALGRWAKSGELPALLRGMIRVPVRRAAGDPEQQLIERLAGLQEAERERLLLELVRAEAAVVLGHSSVQAIDPEHAFKQLGFDSLAAVELRNRLSGISGLRLPATLVFDYPSPASVAGHLLEQLKGEQPVERRPARAERRIAASAPAEPIAIVGMSCRYPGGVRSPEELWELVASGRDAIGLFPEKSWLGSRCALRPRSGSHRHQLHTRGGLSLRRRRIRRELLRDRSEGGALHGSPTAVAARNLVGGFRARWCRPDFAARQRYRGVRGRDVSRLRLAVGGVGSRRHGGIPGGRERRQRRVG